MVLPAALVLFALNLAIASVLSAGVALAVSPAFRSLPKRHAVLVAGLAGCLISPIVVAVGARYSLGRLPDWWSPAARVEIEVSEPHVATAVAPFGPSSHSAREFSHVPREGNPLAATPSRAATPDALPAVTVGPAVAGPPGVETPSSSADILMFLGTLLVVVWIIGAGGLAWIWLRDLARCRRLVRNCQLCTAEALRNALAEAAEGLGLPRDIPLLTSSEVPAPAVVGLIRPVVLVPPRAERLFSPSQLHAVLVHELSHIARKDHWVVALQVCTRIGYWWNPLVYLASRRIAELRELVCDDIATHFTAAPRDYAQSILLMAQRAIATRPAVSSLGIGLSSATELERRVRRLLFAGAIARELRLSRRFVALGLVASGLVGMGLVFAQVPQQPAEADNSAQSTPSESVGAEPVSPPRENKYGKEEWEPNPISGRVLAPDGSPAVGASVFIEGRSMVSEIDVVLTTNEQGAFATTIRTPRKQFGGIRLWAQGRDGNSLAFHRFDWNANPVVSEGLELKLERRRVAQVRVVDGDGQPVTAANVALQIRFPHILGGVSTNHEGLAEIPLPPSERIEVVFAWKKGQGLDYRVYALSRTAVADKKAVAPEFPVDGPQQLVLDGCQPFKVKVVEATGEPIAGVRLYPWTLRKAGEPDSLNLSFFTEFLAETTDESGEVDFAWFPHWCHNGTTVWPQKEGYERIRGNFDPATSGGELLMQLNRLVPIRGQVTGHDGKPATGITIAVRGAGRSFNSFMSSVTSDGEGRYEVLVSPDQIYLLCVQNDRWAAAAQTGFAVWPNQPVEGRDFQLREATRVHGVLVNERTQQPIPDARVIVYLQGTALYKLPDVDLPNPDNERYSVQPIIQYYANTNDEGEFEFFLGDGDYSIRPPQQEKAEEFTITGEREREFIVTTKIEEEVVLVGLVVGPEESKPLANVKVEGVPCDFSGNDWLATTGADGKFTVRRRQQATFVHAVSADRSLAAIAEIEEASRVAFLQLQPVGSVTGRLVNADNTPVVGQQLHYAFDVPDEDNGTRSPRFGGRAVTDEQGHFTLLAIPPGREYCVNYPPTPEGMIPFVTKFTLKPGEHLELGDIEKPAGR